MTGAGTGSSKLTPVTGQGGVILRLEGPIDERFEANAFVAAARGAVIVDVGGVDRITSFGIREWVNALRRLECSYVALTHCRPFWVAQLNMVKDFGGRAEVLSLYLPYLCSACGKDVQVLFDVRERYEALVNSEEPPPLKCEQCGGAAQFDDLAESYFSYVAAQPKPAPPPVALRLLEGSPPPFRLEKQVKGTVTGIWLQGRLEKAGQVRHLAHGLEGLVVVDLEGLEAASPQGLAAIQESLRSTDAQCFLANAPEFWASPEGQVISAWLPTRCAHGHVRPERWNHALLVACGQGEPVLGCPTCGASPDADSMASAKARLAESPPPSEVLTFLSGREDDEVTRATPGLRPVATTETFGRYTLLGRLGAGGMAEVFLARQDAVGGFEKRVVIKRILPSLATDPSFVEMFLQEAKVAARINHPNVVQIFDVAEHAHSYYIAMEYVPGWDLAALLRAAVAHDRRWPVHLALRIIADVCAGLHAAHTSKGPDGAAAPIVHRDVSPHNVLVSEEGQVKLSDFGIAKATNEGGQTPTSTVKGKVSYMPPELLRTEKQVVDPRMDLFPAGIMLVQLLTLSHPFRRGTDYATMRALLEAPLPDLRALSPLGSQLQEVVSRALAREPEDRYQTARQMGQDLERLLSALELSSNAEAVSAFHRSLVAGVADCPESDN